MTNKYKPDEIGKFIKSIPKNIVEKENNKQLDKTKEDYTKFTSALDANKCSFCKKYLKYVNSKSPCLHWLLRPKGVNKKRLLEALKSSTWSHFQLQAYFRWLANYEKPFAGINSFKEDTDTKKLFEITIKYKNIEWTINYSQGDLDGHSGTQNNFPHYHLAMRIDDKPFIDFSDAHIPFTDSDLFNLAAIQSGEMKQRELYGAGLQDLFETLEGEELLDTLSTTDNRNEEVVNLQTIAQADDGSTIKGDDIVKLLEESKKTKVPMAKLLKDAGYKTTVLMSPGKKIPKMFHRSKRKR